MQRENVAEHTTTPRADMEIMISVLKESEALFILLRHLPLMMRLVLLLLHHLPL